MLDSYVQLEEARALEHLGVSFMRQIDLCHKDQFGKMRPKPHIQTVCFLVSGDISGPQGSECNDDSNEGLRWKASSGIFE